MVGNTAYLLVLNSNLGRQSQSILKDLLAFLNSSVALYQLDRLCSKFDETGWRWLRQFVELIKVPKSPKEWRIEFQFTSDEIDYIYSQYSQFLVD